MEERIRDARSQLVEALIQNHSYEQELTEVVQTDIGLQEKLEQIDTEWIKQEIIGNEEGLSYLIDVVRYLRDTGLYICSSHDKSACYSSIPADKESIFKQTVYSHLSKFSCDVISKLGYTEEKNDMLLPSDPMKISLLEMVPIVTTDLVIMTKELEMYLNDCHPHPCRIDDVLPAKVRRKQRKPSALTLRNEPEISACSPAFLMNNAIYNFEKPVPAPRKYAPKKPGVNSSLSLLSAGSSTSSSKKPLVPLEKQSNEESAQSKDCELCGKRSATVSCSACIDNKLLCDDCDDRWHTHVKRHQHQREQLHQQPVCMKPKPSGLTKTNRSSFVIIPGKRGLSSSNASPHPGSHTKPMTGQQADFRELRDELEAETDLSKRMKKAVEMLENNEHKLGGIKYGLEVTDVKERIRLLKEQDFLRNYQENLSNRIRDSRTSESRQTSKARIHYHQKQGLVRKESEDSKHTSRNIPAQHDPEVHEEIYVEDTPISESLVYNYVTSTSHQDCSRVRQTSSSSSISGRSLIGNLSDNCESGEEDQVYETVDTRNPKAYSLEANCGSKSPVKAPPAVDNQIYDCDNILKHSDRSFSKDLPRLRVTKSASVPNSNDSSLKVGWPQPWECEHCTFHNDKGSRICAACCRTSDRPVLLKDDMPHRDLPHPPPEHSISLPTGKSMAVLDQLDAMVTLRKQYSKTAQSASHGKLLAELHRNLESGKMGIKYDDHHPRSSFLRLSTGDPICRLLSKLKEANQENFTVEEFEIANQQSDDRDPAQWLRTTWKSKIQTVKDLVNRELKHTHPLAQLSQDEARLALIEASGDVDIARIIASSRWKEMYDELISNCTHCGSETSEVKDLIIRAMNQSHGDIAKAALELFQETISLNLLNNIQGKNIGCYTNEEDFVCDKPYHLVADDTLPEERRLHILMAEFNLDTLDKAKNVLIIWKQRQRLSNSLMLADVIEAVRNCSNVTKALSYLQQDCAICGGQFPASKIQILSFCQCKLCIGCLKQHFALVIREKQVCNLVCPKCGKPDVSNHEEFEAHIQLLLLMLKHHLAEDEMYLFDKKLTDWSLMQDPNFRWCSYDDCCCGFVFNRQNPQELVMECPECSRLTCFGCKIPWEEGHTGLTCEEFAQLKASQESNSLYPGAASFIQNCGIDCPKCHYRYAIAKGGCLHFTCSQCHYEFCSGCNKPFYRGQECTFLPNCASLGLHCHHPRSCLYYLNSEPINKLQKLLRDHGITFLIDASGSSKNKKQKTCPVIEQKNTNHDEPCGKQVLKNNAGLCEAHYKEYLITLINQHNIDPVSMLTVRELQKQFQRISKEIPEQHLGETPEAYHKRLIMLVKQQIPLPKMKKPSVLVSTK